MPRVSALLILRIATLIALAACAALVVEYRSLDFAFCGPHSGCAGVRRTDLAYLWGLGLTLPELGLIGVSLVFALSLSRAAAWAARLAVAGGAFGLLLILLQALVLKQYCWLCMSVDLPSVVAGAAGMVLIRNPSELKRPSALRRGSWAALAAIALLGPALWPKFRPMPPVPTSIQAYYRTSKINVVEFADFECPFCRNLHSRLQALLAPYGNRVHFVRLNMPLEQHPQAREAALAVICAEDQGKDAALAEFLFANEDLSVPAIREKAKQLGMDLGAFDACRESSKAKERLARESQAVVEAGFDGLPTTYIGGRRIVGAQSDDMFRDALERAARGEDERGVPPWAYVLALIALVLAAVRMGYDRPPSQNELQPAERG